MNKNITGFKVHKRDYRDLVFGDVLSYVNLPRNNITKKLPVDYQDGVPKCLAEAFSYLGRKQDFKETGRDFPLSADGLYSYIKNFIDKERDYGTSIKSGAKAMCEFGIPHEDVFPDDELRWKDKDDYFDKAHFTPAVFSSAKIFSKETYLRGSGFGWGMVNSEEMKQMIFQRQAVVIGVRYDENWGKGGKYPKPPTAYKYLHGICADAWQYTYSHLFFRIANSLEPDPNKRLMENGKAFAWLRWDLWRPHIIGNYTTVDKLNVYPKTKMLRLVRDKADMINGKVYAIINGRRKWLQEPKELEDWQAAKLVGESKDIENITREELEKYPLVKMTFAQFITHYFDK